MHRNPSSISSPAPRRLGRLHALIFLFLAGLLWSWGQAQATTVLAATDELAHAVLVIEADARAETVATFDVAAVCVKPLSTQSSAVDLGGNEISDQEALPQQPVRLLALQVLLRSAAQPAMQQAESQPLLRPPIRLG